MERRWGLPSRGPNSPFSAGNRTILARTCSKCGELADGDSFPLLNTGKKNQTRRRVCHTCQNAQKKVDREQRGIGVPAPRPPEELQTSKYTLWTAEDDQRMRDLVAAGSSYEEIAVELGRSLRSVYKRRSDLGLSKVRKSHRVAKPWAIQIPPPPLPKSVTPEKYEVLKACIEDGWSWDQIIRTHHTSYQTLMKLFPGTSMDLREAGRLGGQVRRLNERLGRVRL